MDPEQRGAGRDRFPDRLVDADDDSGLPRRPAGDPTDHRPHRGRRDVSRGGPGGQLRAFPPSDGDVGEIEPRHEVEDGQDLGVYPPLPRLPSGHAPRRRPGVNVVGIRWNPALTPWWG